MQIKVQHGTDVCQYLDFTCGLPSDMNEYNDTLMSVVVMRH